MFKWGKDKPGPATLEIRDTLFGDMPLARWALLATPTPASEPWSSFVRAQKFIAAGDTQGATVTLQRILEFPGLESRHYLQAHHCLRELGVTPVQKVAKNVLGVLVEVGMKGGLDLVVGYTDHHARYCNYSGAAVVWERPNGSLDACIDDLLRVGGVVAQVIGPSKEVRPPAPTKGRARVNILTPSGIHFGDAPLDALAKDRLGGPVMASASRLMQELMKLNKK